jgi:hypothetical protein
LYFVKETFLPYKIKSQLPSISGPAAKGGFGFAFFEGEKKKKSGNLDLTWRRNLHLDPANHVERGRSDGTGTASAPPIRKLLIISLSFTGHCHFFIHTAQYRYQIQIRINAPVVFLCQIQVTSISSDIKIRRIFSNLK